MLHGHTYNKMCVYSHFGARAKYAAYKMRRTVSRDEWSRNYKGLHAEALQRRDWAACREGGRECESLRTLRRVYCVLVCELLTHFFIPQSATSKATGDEMSTIVS